MRRRSRPLLLKRLYHASFEAATGAMEAGAYIISHGLGNLDEDEEHDDEEVPLGSERAT